MHVLGKGPTLDLRHWVADGAMTVFFLVVGLEIKRELTHGHLPPARRTFLLTLAIADDIGAIVVIAVAYGGHVRVLGLLVAAAALAGAAIVVRAVERELVELAVALVAAWLGLRHAGVHPTLAGVAVGLIAPARRRDVGDTLLERCERFLHPLSGYLVVPVFALAHAGVTLSASALRPAAGSAITWGVVAGLVLGKPVGIGFTVALFITELAFTAPPAREAATIGVLAASVLASVLAAVALRPWRARG